ncbi:MAG: hypothetical protein CM1200mP21_10400 [Candidatus Poseidoniales archaeon]|nr:MAG: hypothetical protein CM1200mP21_10400 [Candidatus Poseidoniales archaeon]
MSKEKGTITLRSEFASWRRDSEETDRLEKLYVAYKKVEDEFSERNAEFEVLEKQLIDSPSNIKPKDLLRIRRQRVQN